MKLNATSLLSLSVIIISAFIFTSSCKKSNNNSAALSASVNGAGFTPALPVAFDFHVAGVLGVGGYTNNGTDTSTLSIQFSHSSALNKPVDVTGAGIGNIQWMTKTTAKRTIYDSWAGKSHGILTVTSLDKSNKKVAGQFSGVLYAVSGTDSVTIANGQFNLSFIAQ
jgi:hypothetical protein